VDGVGEKHDFIRGVPGNFNKLEQRLEQLLSLRQQLNNLTIGIHSVVSVFNIGHLEEIITYADQSGADQFITEIAEPRVELDMVGLPITPSAESYAKAIDRLIVYLESKRFTGVARIAEALRVEYYKLVKRILEEQDQVIACYAGWVSAHIYADGTVWPCCVRADNLGNLRDHNYDFKEIWFGEKIQEVRRSIAAKKCHCPLANASYTNMLHDLATLARVGAKVLRGTAATKPLLRRPQRGRAATQETAHHRGESTAFDWLDKFQHHMKKDPDYAVKTLAAYRLGMKAKGSIVGVVVQPAPDCCTAARALAAGKVYHPDQAPLLPLPGCPQAGRCGCLYRPATSYQQADEGDLCRQNHSSLLWEQTGS
jgi:hypothetical protein